MWMLGVEVTVKMVGRKMEWSCSVVFVLNLEVLLEIFHRICILYFCEILYCFWTVWIILKQGLDCFEVFVAADLWTTLVQVMEQFDAS
ncbi:unnamed protein product [Vicia faba]|uniref:Uncharacterized protein n=1 Tax=Vicia faba TaxID=3906 RepID=A0AAV0ZCZ5_VICFA|nr:unnamed protein product [Vicia faba]